MHIVGFNHVPPPCGYDQQKADVIAHQRTASIAFRLGSNMMNFGGNCRAIAANCGDNPDKLRFWVGVVASMWQPP